MYGQDHALEDPNKYVDLCDKVSPTAILSQQCFGNFLRFSIIPGITGVLYQPKEIAVDDITTESRGPFSIESAKSRTISAVFVIPKIAQDNDTRIFCPAIQARDVSDREGLSVCKGFSTHRVVDNNSKLSVFKYFYGSQLRLLPHASSMPTCPVP
jgi:hypothetical protein